MNKIGVFGGSFNPIHNAHIKTVEIVKETLNLTKVLIIPAGNPPHKQNVNMESGFHRLKMCKLAFENFDYVTVNDFEIKRGGISYTYNTIKALKSEYKTSELYLIMGADMFLTLDKWNNPDEIFKNSIVVTLPRNNGDFKALQEQGQKLMLMGARITIINNKLMPESSTEIREKISENQDFSQLVPEKVHRYILENDLYHTGSD